MPVSRILLLSMCLAGCALGGGPGEPRRVDAGERFDAGAPSPGFDAGCGASCGEVVDADGDGVPEAEDCDDADAAIGRTGGRACSTDCGDGTQACTDGVWSACDAPVTCECPTGSECTPGDVDMGATCGNCGREERRCMPDCRWGAMTCVDQGACVPGTSDSESRSCPGTCGGTQRRSRMCTASCTWGTFDAWGPACPSCGGCGDGTCGAGETCSSCADCRAGHLGSGSGGTSCAGVPEGQWRCVTQAGLGVVSQVCRSGAWVNFNLSPRDCSACVCAFSAACCQPGSPSTGC